MLFWEQLQEGAQAQSDVLKELEARPPAEHDHEERDQKEAKWDTDSFSMVP